MENPQDRIYSKYDDYERSESRQSQSSIMSGNFTTRVGTLELKVPRTRDGEVFTDGV